MKEQKPRRGRPKTVPAGAKVRNMRLTDAEYAEVKELVKQMRKER